VLQTALVPVDSSPKISIVTASYNQLSWLKLCAASIADQEGVSYEHIVQDAQTGPELEDWIRQNTAAQLYVERDAGMYDAINRGLRRAKGEICAYLNCDEQYLPGTLLRVADYFDQHPEVDVVFGDAILADQDLNPVSYRRVMVPERWHTLLRPLNVLTCSTFFRRKVVDDGALFDPSWKIIGDKAWLIGLLDHGYRMAALNEPLSVFALTGFNLSQHRHRDTEKERWEKDFSAPFHFIGPFVRLHHWWCKWLVGAYRPYMGDLRYYRPDDLARRTDFTNLKLGSFWPKPAESTLSPETASPNE
jgi:glycosyltransferase involved in cell wall biosynthesis